MKTYIWCIHKTPNVGFLFWLCCPAELTGASVPMCIRVNTAVDSPELFTHQWEAERERSFTSTLEPRSFFLFLTEWMNFKHRTQVYLIMKHPAGFTAFYHLKESEPSASHGDRTKKPRSQKSWLSFSLVQIGLIKAHLRAHLRPDSDHGSVAQHHLADTCCC